MKILKLLNKKNLSIVSIFLLLITETIAEEKPVDIWNIDKIEIEKKDENSSDKETSNKQEILQKSIYNLQNQKQIQSIEFNQTLESQQIKIVGLYDPEDNGLDIDMWSNSDGDQLKNIFSNINSSTNITAKIRSDVIVKNRTLCFL